MAAPISDLAFAARRLRGNPSFAAASVLALALGIGASTAIFSVIDGVLLKPLPYPHAERLVAIWHTAPGIHIKDLYLANSLYFTYSEENRVFDDVGMWQSGAWSLTGVSEAEEVPGLSVTNRFLHVLEIEPALGRHFTAADDNPSNELTVMLSDGYWKSHFGGDPSVLGRRVMVNGNPSTVIGVLPPSFQFLDRKISVLLPMQLNRSEVRLVSFCCHGIARLKPAITLTQANRDIARMLLLAPAKFPVNTGFNLSVFTDARIAPNLRPLKDVLVGDISGTLWMLMGTVGIVLLIACANVANLLLVRADGRRHELAIRAALGGGWRRIARELLLESMLLSLAGGAFGLALAYGAVRVLVALDLPHLPRIHNIAIDPAVLAFTLCISLSVGFLFGLIPVFKYARPQLSNVLAGDGRSRTQSKQRHRARSLLVVAQVALASVLLVGSGLMIRTFQALRNVDPGFSGAPEVETFHIYIPPSQVKEADRTLRMQEQILHRIEAVAGVSAVAVTNGTPLESCCESNPVHAEGQEAREGSIPPIRRFKYISPGYISAIGSRLIAGRELTWVELYNGAPVVLLSENMARETWRDPHAAIGKRLRPPNDEWREVIGVVADLRDDGIDAKAPTMVYLPLLRRAAGRGSVASRGVVYLIRTPRAGSKGLRQEIQQAVAGVNPDLPVAGIKTLQSVYDRSLARVSFTVLLLAIAGVTSLILGVVGIYGVISYSVSQRTREIGIRIALGAPLPDVSMLFVRHGLVISAIGAICGLPTAVALTRLMKSLLFEVSPADPVTYAAVSTALILAAALASYLPARRASRVDPVDALRAE